MSLGHLFIRSIIVQGYLQMHQRYHQSCDIPVSVSQVLRDHLQCWTNFSSLKEVSPLHQKEHNLLLSMDAFLKGWDALLRYQTVVCGIMKSQVTSFRIIRKSSSESKSVAFHRQFISGCLSEQAGRYPLSGNVCLNLKNQGLDECQEDSDLAKNTSQGISSFLPVSLSRKYMVIQFE